MCIFYVALIYLHFKKRVSLQLISLIFFSVLVFLVKTKIQMMIYYYFEWIKIDISSIRWHLNINSNENLVGIFQAWKKKIHQNANAEHKILYNLEA